MTETEMTVYQPGELAPAKLFEGGSGTAMIEQATEIADALAGVIEKKKLFSMINGRKHVVVEGWTLLGSLVGVFPVCVWTRKVENPDGWEARVEARTLSGQVVGASEAECLRTERTWSSRDDYALRSMAQTRATSKALRLPLGFVMTLAGYDATPAEEMPRDEPPARSQGRRRTKPEVVEGEVVDKQRDAAFDLAFGEEQQHFDLAAWKLLWPGNDLTIADFREELGIPAGAGWQVVQLHCDAWALANPDAEPQGNPELALVTRVLEQRLPLEEESDA